MTTLRPVRNYQNTRTPEREPEQRVKKQKECSTYTFKSWNAGPKKPQHHHCNVHISL